MTTIALIFAGCVASFVVGLLIGDNRGVPHSPADLDDEPQQPTASMRDQTSSRAFTIRRRLLRRKRAERVLTIAYRALALIGAGVIVTAVLGLLP